MIDSIYDVIRFERLKRRLKQEDVAKKKTEKSQNYYYKMENGTIVESGNHQELLNQKGKYLEL